MVSSFIVNILVWLFAFLRISVTIIILFFKIKIINKNLLLRVSRLVLLFSKTTVPSLVAPLLLLLCVLPLSLLVFSS